MGGGEGRDGRPGERDEAGGAGDGDGLSGVPLDTLIALLAARSGVHPTAYVYTRTDSQFAADAAAWVQSFALPASMLLGGMKGSGGSGPKPGRPPLAPRRGKWDWLQETRHAPGTRVSRSFVDFDEWDRPETVDRLEAALAGVNKKQRMQRYRPAKAGA